MRIRLMVPLVLMLSAALLVPAGAQAAKRVHKRLAVPAAGQVNVAVFQVKVKGNKKPKLRLKGKPGSGVFAAGALHRVKGQRHKWAGEVAILRKGHARRRAVAAQEETIEIVISVPAGKVSFTEYDIADAVLGIGRELGVNVCDPNGPGENIANAVLDAFDDLGLEPDPAWDQRDIDDMLDDAYRLACGRYARYLKLLMLLDDFGATVMPSANHNPSAGKSNECFSMMMIPSEPGSTFKSVLTGPGGYTTTQVGTILPNGTATAVHPITRFGDYTDDLTITNGNGLSHTWTIPFTINGSEKPGPGCPMAQ